MLTIIDEVFGSMTEEEFRSKLIPTITETEAKKLVTVIEPITVTPEDDILLASYNEEN